MNKSTYPSFVLTKFSIENVDGKIINLDINNVAEFNFTESLMFPGITGELYLIDNLWDIFQWKNIYPGAKLHVGIKMADNISVQLRGNNLNRTFIIYAIDTVNTSHDTYSNRILFKFCTESLLDAYIKKYQQYYFKKDLNYIVKDIINKGFNGKIDTSRFEKIKQKPEHFTLPLWSPIHSLKYIMSFALSKERNVGGYLFYEDAQKNLYRFETYEQVKKYAYEMITSQDYKYVIKTNSVLYLGSIEHASLYDFDIMEKVQRGANQTKVSGLFYDKNTIEKYDKSIKDIKEFNPISQFMTIPKKYFSKDYETKISTFLYPNKDGAVEKDELKDFLMGFKTTLYTKFMDFIKLNLMTPGHIGRRVGDGIRIIFPAIQKNKTKDDTIHSGVYVIRDLKHVIKGRTYYTYMTTIKDGYEEFQYIDTSLLNKWRS